MNLKEFRKSYPEYDDMDDEQLVNGLHQKLYSDIPKRDFYEKIGYRDKPDIMYGQIDRTPVHYPPETPQVMPPPTAPVPTQLAQPQNMIPATAGEPRTPEFPKLTGMTPRDLLMRAYERAPEDPAMEIVKKNLKRIPERGKQVGSKMLAAAVGPMLDYLVDPNQYRKPDIADEFAQDIWVNAQKKIMELHPNVKHGSLKYYTSAMFNAAADMGLSVTAGILSGNPNVGLAIMTSQVYMDKKAESLMKGRSEEQSTYDALFYAITEGLTEKVPLGILTKGGGKFLTRLFKGMGAEGLQEVFAEGAQIAYERGVLKEGEELTAGQIFRRLWDSGIIGMGTAGIITLSTAPVFKAMDTKHGVLSRAINEGVDNISEADLKILAEQQAVEALAPDKAKLEVEEIKAAKVAPEAGTVKDHNFFDTGDYQRGLPEQAMLRVQQANGGGVLNPVVENVGDLTHRMTEFGDWNSFGYEYVADKVDKALHALTFPYGFAKEHSENIAVNAEYRDPPIPVEQQQVAVDNALARYAEEHKNVPVHNYAQKTARDAAIAIGEQRWNDAIKHLRTMEMHLSSPEAWSKWAGKNFKRNPLPEALTPVEPQTQLEEEAIEEEMGDVARSVEQMQAGKNYVHHLRHQAVTPPPRVLRQRTGKPVRYTIPDKPVRRENIVRILEKNLGAKIYHGHFKGSKRTLGFFRPSNKEVRIRYKNELEVVAHEIAHWLDRKYPMFKQSWKNKELREELQGVSYDKKKTYEGFAEFVRLYMTQEHEAVLNAPKYYDKFTELIAGHEIEKTVHELQEKMHQWYYQGALKRFESKIGEPPVPMRQRIGDMVHGLGAKAVENIFDALHGIKIMESTLNGRIGDADLSPYKDARLVAGWRGVVKAVFQHGTIGWDANGNIVYTGKGLQQVFEPAADIIREAMLYFAARRAQETTSQGRENLFTGFEIQAALDLGKKYPVLPQVFQEYQAFKKRMYDFYEQSGILNKETRKMFEEINKNYVPFQRVIEIATGETHTPRGTFHRLKGGSQNVADIWDNIVFGEAMLIHAALVNHAKRSAYNMIDRSATGHGALFAVKIPKDIKAVEIETEQFKDAFLKATMNVSLGKYTAMQDAGQGNETIDVILDLIDGGMGDFATFFTFGHKPTGRDVDSVMRGGKREFYQVADPLFFKSMQAFGPKSVNFGMQMLGFAKNLATRTITTMPDFQLPNIVRDSYVGYTLSKGKFIPLVSSMQGAVDRLLQTDVYWDFLANGGYYSSTVHGENQDLQQRLEHYYTSKGINYKTVLDTPAKLMSAWEELTSAAEYGTRLQEYKINRAQGKSKREAAFQGREISTDFGMRGSSEVMRFFTSSVPFMNARLEGLYRLHREVAEKETGRLGLIGARAGQFAIRTALGITLPSLLLYYLNKDDERYKALPEWVKDLHWVILPSDPDAPAYIIPKPFETGAIFATIPERIFELIEQKEGKKFAKAMQWIVLDAMSMNPTPQLIKPPVDIGLDRKFTGANIIPDDLKHVDPHEQFRPWTSETMIKLGKELGWSPMKMEYMVRGYLGTLGAYMLMATDAMMQDEERMGERPELRLDQYPIIKRFIKQQPYRGTSYETDFYNLAAEIVQTVNTFEKIGKELRGGDLQEYLSDSEKATLFSLSQVQQDIAKNLTEINTSIRQVTVNKNISAKEKREQIDSLLKDKQELLRQTMKLLTESELKKISKGVEEARGRR